MAQWRCSKPRACWLFVLQKALLAAAGPSPWWERGPSHWEGGVLCQLLFAKVGCRSCWAILAGKRNMGHNTGHTENEVWISWTVEKEYQGRQGRAQIKFSCSRLAKVIAAFEWEAALVFASRGFICRSYISWQDGKTWVLASPRPW